MVLPQVIVWPEHWQVNYLTPVEWDATSQEMVLKVSNYATARALEIAMHLMNFGKHVVKAHKRSLLEVDQVLAIRGASLHEQDERVIVSSRLPFLNPLRHFLLDQGLAALVTAVDHEALRRLNHLADGVVEGCLELRHEA